MATGRGIILTIIIHTEIWVYIEYAVQQANPSAKLAFCQCQHSAVLDRFCALRRIPVTMVATRRKMVKLKVVLLTKLMVGATSNFQQDLKLN